MKRVRIRSFSDRYFLPFGLNTERYSASLRIQSVWGKILTRKTPNTDTFHVVTGITNITEFTYFIDSTYITFTFLIYHKYISASNFTESNTPPWIFFTFLNCRNATKLRKASHMKITKAIWVMSLKWVNLVILAPSHITDIVHTALSLNCLMNFRKLPVWLKFSLSL